jgi:hypothetical protein
MTKRLLRRGCGGAPLLLRHLLKLRHGWSFVLMASSVVSLAQTDSTRIYGPEDSGIPTPAIRIPMGQQDVGALQELLDYLKAVNVGPWQGLKGAGTFAGSATDPTNADQASLAISQGDRFRLDVHTPNGVRTTRIAGSYGKTVDSHGSWPLPRATARLGLVFFPQLLTATFPTPRTSLVDRGEITIEGRTLHRITVEEPLTESQPTTNDSSRVSVVDLYFDTTSHLLFKSAAAIQLDSADRARYIDVLTYEDYRKVDNSLIAFRFHQSLNGQPQWTLQLSSATLTPDTNAADFYF